MEFGDIGRLLWETCPKGNVPKLCQKTFHGQKSSTAANTHITRGGKEVPHGVAHRRRDGTAQPGDGHPNTKPTATLPAFPHFLLGQPMRRGDEGAAF